MVQSLQAWASDDDLDMDNVSTDAPEALENGIYNATIVKAELKETSTGKPAIGVEFKITHAYGGNPGDLSRKLFDTITVASTGGALFKAKQLALAAGVEPLRKVNAELGEQHCSELLAADPIWVQTKQEKNPRSGEYNARPFKYLTGEEAAAAAGSVEADATGVVAETSEPKRRRRAA